MLNQTRIVRAGVACAVLGFCFAVAGCGGASSPTPAAPAAAAPAVAAQAQPADDTEAHRHHHHRGMIGLIGMSLKQLDLSPEQRVTVEKIRADLRAKMDPARAAGGELAGTLADGVAAGSLDRTKVDAAIAKLSAAAEAGHAASFDALNQLHAALTPAQRAAVVDKLQSHWEKWKESQGKEEADEHPGRGHIGGFAKDLDLSPEQQAKIHGAFREEMKARPQDHEHKEVRDHMQAFGTAFKADTFDAKSVAGGGGASRHMAQWGATRMARVIELAIPVLTPEQRTKLAQSIRTRSSHSDS